MIAFLHYFLVSYVRARWHKQMYHVRIYDPGK